MNRTICYYHGNCFDGMAAAWVVRRYMMSTYLDTGSWEFIPATYGDDKLITNITQDCYENANINDSYIIVDFSFPRQLMEMMYQKAKSMIVLDHHKSVEADCKGLPFCKFDLRKSGAGLAWSHFFPGETAPQLVQYIEDRDLWKFSLFASTFINAFIQSFPMEFNTYEYLYEQLESDEGKKDAHKAGMAIERYKSTMVDAMCKRATIKSIFGFKVPVVNGTLLFSEVGHKLCELYPNAPFAASYMYRPDGKISYSLRSIGDFDCSAIAKVGGGGGHRNAAGFESYTAVHVDPVDMEKLR